MMAALFGILCAAILVCWSPEYAAVGVPQAALFLLAIVSAVRLALGRAVARLDFVLLPLAGAVLWGVWQELTNHTIYSFETWKAVLYWTANLTACFLALQVLQSTAGRERFLRWLVWFVFGLSLVSITQYFTSPGKVYWLFPSPYAGVLGPFIYKNQYAALIELVLPVAIYRAVFRSRRSLFDAAAAAVMFATVLASLSRAGFVLVAAEVVVLGAMAWFRGMRTGVAALAALCVIFSAIAGWQLTWSRFQDRESFDIRRELLISSFAMVRDRPWAGFGLGTWRTAYPAYARFDNGMVANRAHSDWMEWAVEGGIPFALLLAAVFLWTAPRAVRSIWGLGVVVVFLHCLMDYPIREPALGMLFFAMTGAVAGYIPRHKLPGATLGMGELDGT